MTVLYESGNFKIISEKLDNCSNDSRDICIMILFLAVIFSTVCFLALNLDVIFGTIPLILMILILGLFLKFPNKCGIRIKLNGLVYTNGRYLHSSDIQLSDNPDKDRQKIKNVVEYIKKDIDKYKKEDEENMKKSKECCIKYKNVISDLEVKND